MSVRLDELNARSERAAYADFLRCCGSTRWARMMSAARPFASLESMADRADAIWRSLDRTDWLEAFAAHPQIGQDAGRAGGAGGAGTPGGAGSDWAAHEQSGVRGAADDVRDRLGRGNREYLSRFGYIFIVCATGKSAEEMLVVLERRLTHDPEQELPIAAEEQRQITQLRMAKLLT